MAAAVPFLMWTGTHIHPTVLNRAQPHPATRYAASNDHRSQETRPAASRAAH